MILVRAGGPALESDDPREILKELAKEVLKELAEELPSPPAEEPGKAAEELPSQPAEQLPGQPESSGDQGRETLEKAVLREVGQQARLVEFLSAAQESRDKLDGARAAAARALGRPEFAGWGITGALAAYLGLFLGNRGSRAGLAPLIIAVLAVALGARVTWRFRLRQRHRGNVAAAERSWLATLREDVLKPFIVQQKNFLASDRLQRKMTAGAVPATSYGRDPELAVTSAAMLKVAATARTIAWGSIGISGPRGAGKSTILNKFDTREVLQDPEQDIRVHVTSPVDYNAREFIVHLFTELCVKVQAEAPAASPIAIETRRRLGDLRFLNTYSSSWGSTLLPTAMFSLTGTRGKERAEQPVVLPALVAQFRAYGERVAEWNRSRKGRAKGRVIICIDEMDKIRDSSRAEQFLNDIKAIFDIPGCLYLVSISEDAMTVFASQTPAIRTAFDSAFDEIISVPTMTFAEAQDLLTLRVTGVPRPFLALCHVLAGGVPRELIRAARALIHEARELAPEERDLPRVTRRLIQVRCKVMREEAILQLGRSGAAKEILLPLHEPPWPGLDGVALTSDGLADAAEKLKKIAKDQGQKAAEDQGNNEWTKMCQDVAVALSFYAAVTELFCEHSGCVIDSLKNKKDPRIDDLAIARHAMRMNSELAQALLDKYRTDHPTGASDDGN